MLMSQDDINKSFYKRLKRLEKGTDMATEDPTPPQGHLEPPSSLHTKLQTIVLRLGWLTEADDIDQVIKDLTQAFEESGYIDASSLLEVSNLLAKQAAEVLKMTEIMTHPVFKLIIPRTKDA